MVQSRVHKTMYPINNPVALGQRIRAARDSRHWTRTDLSLAANQLMRQDHPDRTAIPDRWIERLERGEIPSLDLERMTYVAHALKMSLAEIITEPLTYMITPQMSQADFVVSLRNFGLTDQAIESVLEYAIHWKNKVAPPETMPHRLSPTGLKKE